MEMVEFLPFIFMLLGLGCIAGFLAGLLGVGGGIVLVPGLFYILTTIQDSFFFNSDHLMHICVGTSLAIIVPTGFSSARAHHKRGAVDFSLVRQIGAGVMIGVLSATYIAAGLEGNVLKMIFASALPVFAILMVIGRKIGKNLESVCEEPSKNRKNIVAGVLIGFISTLVGIGGATLSVPYMTLNGVRVHKAVGTASALGLVIAVPAALGFMMIGWAEQGLPPFSIGYVNILAWGCVIPASIAVAPLGARLAHKIPVRPLRIVFAVFIVIVALNMWWTIL